MKTIRSPNRFRPWTLVPWLLAVAVLVLAGTIIWRGPLRPGPSWLSLLVYDPAGRTAQRIRLDASPNDPLGAETPRVALVLALRNDGPAALRARALSLSLPSWLRLERDDGTPLEAEAEDGNPLIRYHLEFEPVRVEPGRPPVVLPGIGRLWIRPFTSPWRCSLDDDGLPTFVPAPALAPERLADATLFWSAHEAGSSRRGTGTIQLVLDPAAFATPPAVPPPSFRSRPVPPGTPVVDVSRLPVAGRRVSDCGSIVEPMTLHSTVYSVGTAGRVLAVGAPERPTRLLFDLDGNDTIEAEAWAGTASGRIDTTRRARYPLPEFLLPLPPMPAPDTLPAEPGDSVPVAPEDSIDVAPDTTRRPPPDTTGRGGGP